MKVIAHFKPPRVSGGVEKFERELMDIALDIETNAVLYNIGNFFDNIIVRVLSLYYPKIYAISHVNKNWKHLGDKRLKKITSHLLNSARIQLLLIGENQIDNYDLDLKPKIIGTFTNHKSFRSKGDKFNSGRINTYALYYGRLDAEKNLVDLIDTWQRVTNKQLVLIGPSSSKSYRDILNLKVRESENVRIYDYMSFEELSVFIDECDYGIIHSLSDTVPLMFVEMYVRGKWCLVNSRCKLTEYLPEEYSYELENDNSLKMAIKAIESKKSCFMDEIFSVQRFKERLNGVITEK